MEAPDLFFAGHLIKSRLDDLVKNTPELLDAGVSVDWFIGASSKTGRDLGLYQDAPCYLIYLVEDTIQGEPYGSTDGLVYQTSQLWAVDTAISAPHDQGRAGGDYRFFGKMIWHMRQSIAGMPLDEQYSGNAELNSIVLASGRYPVSYRSGFAVQPTGFSVDLTFRSHADRVK